MSEFAETFAVSLNNWMLFLYGQFANYSLRFKTARPARRCHCSYGCDSALVYFLLYAGSDGSSRVHRPRLDPSLRTCLHYHLLI